MAGPINPLAQGALKGEAGKLTVKGGGGGAISSLANGAVKGDATWNPPVGEGGPVQRGATGALKRGKG